MLSPILSSVCVQTNVFSFQQSSGAIQSMGICTRLIYLSCRVLLMFCLMIPTYPPEAAIFLALMDSRHQVSSARMKTSSLSLQSQALSLLQAPMGSARRTIPSSLPERGRQPMGERWAFIGSLKVCTSSGGLVACMLEGVAIERRARITMRNLMLLRISDLGINQFILLYGFRDRIQVVIRALLQSSFAILVRMGCGAVGGIDVVQARSQLSGRIRRRIQSLKDKQIYSQVSQFVTPADMEIIEKALPQCQETLSVGSVNRLEAGQKALLSVETRIIWKLAILDFDSGVANNHAFTLTPTAKSEKTLQRFYEISLDVGRTFTSIGELSRQDLSIILQNISLYFQGVGYTQGMNFIVGFLLLCGFTPSETCEIFIRLSQSKYFLLIRNFNQNFQNANSCITLMQMIMGRNEDSPLKKVKVHIQELGLNLFIFVFSWFLTYFLYTCNIRSSVLIWNYLLLHHHQQINIQQIQSNNSHFGNGFVNSLNLALKIMESLSSQILACQNSQQLMNLLRNQSMQAYLTENKVFQLIEQSKSKPLLSQGQFLEIIKDQDPQLYKLVQDKKDVQGPIDETGMRSIQKFIIQCKELKQIQSTSNVKANIV